MNLIPATIITGAGGQQIARLGACDLEPRACVRDILDPRIGLRILQEPAVVDILRAIAGGQLKFILSQTGDGEIAPQPPLG